MIEEARVSNRNRTGASLRAPGGGLEVEESKDVVASGQPKKKQNTTSLDDPKESEAAAKMNSTRIKSSGSQKP